MASLNDFLTGRPPVTAPANGTSTGVSTGTTTGATTGTTTGATGTGGTAASTTPATTTSWWDPFTWFGHGSISSLFNPNTWAAVIEHALFGLLKDAGAYLFHVLMRPVFWVMEFGLGLWLMFLGFGIMIGFSKTGQAVGEKVIGTVGALAMFVK